MKEKTGTKSPKRGFTGFHMLMVMGGFFLTIFTVNFTMVYFSRVSWTGLVVQNSYVASQDFNHQLEAQTKLKEAGWRAELLAVGRETRTGLASAEMEQAAGPLFLITRWGQPASGCEVTAMASRPMHTHEDVTLLLAARHQGAYALPHSLLEGRWDLRINAKCAEAGAPLQRVYRLRDGRLLSLRSARYEAR